jgi:hypothetical protein
LGYFQRYKSIEHPLLGKIGVSLRKKNHGGDKIKRKDVLTYLPDIRVDCSGISNRVALDRQKRRTTIVAPDEGEDVLYLPPYFWLQGL